MTSVSATVRDVVLSIRDLEMIFPGPDGAPLRVLDGVSFDVLPHDKIAVVGPSGCGKTTLLRLIAGLGTPTSGEIEVDGRSPIAARRAGCCGMLFQSPVLLPWLDVRRNVELPGRITRKAAAVERAGPRIRQAGLAGFEKALPHQLSGGMRARAALARALTMEPKILLMDEPFASLDAMTRQLMQTELVSIFETEPAALVLVTHNIEEAVMLSHRVYVLSERPARIRQIVDVNLPPLSARDRSTREAPEFLAARRQIEELTLGTAPAKIASPYGKAS